MQCQVCGKVIDLCSLVESDNEADQYTSQPEIAPVTIADSVNAICQPCFQSSRSQQHRRHQLLNQQTELIKLEKTQLSRQLIKAVKPQKSDLDQYFKELQQPEPKDSPPPEQHMQYNPDQERFLSPSAAQLNERLATIRYQYYQNRILNNIFPLSPANCSIMGFRLVPQSDAPTVSLDEVNAGLYHLAQLAAYLAKRRGLAYRVIPALPAPLVHIGRVYQPLFFRQQNKILRKFNKAVNQEKVNAAVLTTFCAIALRIYETNAKLLPDQAANQAFQTDVAVTLPAWSLRLENNDQITQLEKQMQRNIIITQKFECTYEETDFIKIQRGGVEYSAYLEEEEPTNWRVFMTEMLTLFEAVQSLTE